jgi:RNA 2',3'-cyclic 3'-phosphodiesterase
MNSSTWRVFCAVEIPEEISRLTLKHIEKLQCEFPNVAASWSREGKLHLTLKFLGNIPLEQVDYVSDAASRAGKGVPPFEISLAGAGAFPKHGPPRVIWIGVEDSSGRLSKLQERLEKECEQKGFPREDRAFNPHLTLARLRNPQGAKELAARHKALGFGSVSIGVEELLVIRSELSPKGSRYSIISRHSLR